MDYWIAGIPFQHSRGGTKEIHVKLEMCYSLTRV